jgi:hypothetical protein
MPSDYPSYGSDVLQLFQTLGKSLRGKDANVVLGATALLAGYTISNFFPEKDPEAVIGGFTASVKRAHAASCDSFVPCGKSS